VHRLARRRIETVVMSAVSVDSGDLDGEPGNGGERR
jgi:hypothetical protein